MRRSVLGLALVALALSCLLATVLLGQQKPTFRSGVDIVVVDVRAVEGSGRPVSDLGFQEVRDVGDDHSGTEVIEPSPDRAHA